MIGLANCYKCHHFLNGEYCDESGEIPEAPQMYKVCDGFKNDLLGFRHRIAKDKFSAIMASLTAKAKRKS